MPDVDEKQSEGLRKKRQRLHKEIETLRQTCASAEKFEEAEREIQRKSTKKDELERDLHDLLEKHNDAFVSLFGKKTNGPWSEPVNCLVKSGEESNRAIEYDLRKSERELDRACQCLEQSRVEEEQLLNEVEQLKKKIFD
ncbi:unnamed protein product, partial [Strongylus vulgaris]